MNHGSKSVLIIEDESIIARDIEMAFSDAGWFVVGLCSNLEDAEKTARQCQPDVAIVDLNLRRKSSLHVAEYLMKKNVRVVLFTGDNTDRLPASLEDAAIVSKPADMRDLMARCS